MNLGTEQLAVNMEEWAAAVLSINTVEHPPTSLSQALPLVVGEVLADRRSDREAKTPGIAPYQQVLVRARDVVLLLMVSPEPSWDATRALYGYVDELAESLRLDPTLGGRVHQASTLYEASYDPPEVEYQDGTVARAATFQLTVSELIGATR